MESRLTAMSGGTEQKGKRTHGHEQQRGDCWGRGCTGTKKIMERKYKKD